MSAEGGGLPIFGRKQQGAAPPSAELRRAPLDGKTSEPGFKPFPIEAPEPPPAASVQPAVTEGPEPELTEEKILELLYPKEYEAVRTVRAHDEPSVLFVPKDGMPFSYPNSHCGGVRPLPDGEGLAVTYVGEVVEIRGDKLLKVFFELSGHRAHIVREWRTDWARRPQDRTVIRSITVKVIDPPAHPEGEGSQA